MKYKLVVVDWVDAAFEPGWKHSREARPTWSTCKTTGYLVVKNKQKIAIAMNVNDDGGYGETMVIPRSTVRKITVLTKVK